MVVRGAKTACKTCYRKKKRCDEMRPTCRACEKAGHLCEGYSASSSSSPSPSPSSVNTAVKVETEVEVEIGEKVQIGRAVEIGVSRKSGEKSLMARQTGRGGREEEEKCASEDKNGGKRTGEKRGKKEEQKKKSENSESEDWEEITHTDALPAGKPGEFGVVELD